MKTLDTQSKRYIATGFCLMALAVALGAFGAHALKNSISEHYLSVFETANKYHFIHALGLIVVLFTLQQYASSIQRRVLFLLFSIGIILFSGSLYVLSIAELIGQPGLKFMGAITPFGGVLFIIAWVYSAILILKK